jgi:hypothetical protein
VIQSSGDVQAISSGPPQFPFRALLPGLETVVRPAESELVTRFPVSLYSVVTHASGRTWAGSVGGGHHLYIITLEGGDTLLADNQPQPPLAT